MCNSTFDTFDDLELEMLKDYAWFYLQDNTSLLITVPIISLPIPFHQRNDAKLYERVP